MVKHRLKYAHTRPAMRALVQRVSRASVTRRRASTVSEIGPGLLVLLGVAREDGAAAAERLAAKVRALRVFADAEGNMNEPLGEREILCVSQFTLYGDTRRGNRPSFVAAAPGRAGRAALRALLRAAGRQRGVFGARMAGRARRTTGRSR